jgi:diadenosine tetraphosphate (Ap4A) HIT family hydrolase
MSSKVKHDTIDFRDLPDIKADPSCPFCRPETRTLAIIETKSVFAIEDNYPVSYQHMLIITKRHTPDYFTMTVNEKQDAEELIKFLRERILNSDPSVEGFNVGVNCGEAAGQTIFHAHIHLIPRRKSDTPNPRGGVRGVIPDKMMY